MKKKLLTMALAAAFSAACMTNAVMAEAADETAESVTLTDLAGREVTVDLPVENAYLGYYYENFLAVVGPDAFTKVKATSLYDTEGYDNTIPRLYTEYVEGYTDMVDIGSTMQDNFDLEKLIELDCDVAIMGQYQYNAIADKVDLLEEAGIPVVIIDYTTASEETHVKSTEILGQIFQVEDRAEEICEDYKEHMHAIEEKTAQITDKVTTFHEYDSVITSFSEIGWSEYKDSLFGHYLDLAGADDIVDMLSDSEKENSSHAVLDIEYILEKDPQVWFVIGGESTDPNKDGVLLGYGVTEDEVTASAEGMIEARPGFSGLAAVTDGQIYFVNNNLLRTLRDYTIVEYIAKSLYPDEFSDLDPEADLAAFSEKYLPSLPTDGIFFYHYEPEA